MITQYLPSKTFTELLEFIMKQTLLHTAHHSSGVVEEIAALFKKAAVIGKPIPIINLYL